jgi:phosphoglycolate phosphatase
LTTFGFPTHPTDSYRYFVGQGRDQLISRALPEGPIPDQVVSDFSAAVTAEYTKHWADNTIPYPGISELLARLEKLSLHKAVLSNKPHRFTQVMVDQLLSFCSFDIVQGVTPSIPPKPDPAAAMEIAQRLRISPADFLYIGDTNTDMRTANASGMFAAGALWGFRTADELLQSGAKTLLREPADVLQLL